MENMPVMAGRLVTSYPRNLVIWNPKWFKDHHGTLWSWFQENWALFHRLQSYVLLSLVESGLTHLQFWHLRVSEETERLCRKELLQNRQNREHSSSSQFPAVVEKFLVWKSKSHVCPFQCAERVWKIMFQSTENSNSKGPVGKDF